MTGMSPIPSPSSENPTRTAITPLGRLSQNASAALAGSPAPPSEMIKDAGEPGPPRAMVIVRGMVMLAEPPLVGAWGVPCAGAVGAGRLSLKDPCQGLVFR